MRKSNYDKKPAIKIDGWIKKGWDAIIEKLNDEISIKEDRFICIIECYQGVYYEELLNQLNTLRSEKVIDTRSLFKSSAEIETMVSPYLKEDRLFGQRTPLSIIDFFDPEKLAACKEELEKQQGVILVYGHGAIEVCPQPDLLLYVDMTRWEIQQRFRRKEINGLGVENKKDENSIHYKRGYFIDWIVCDKIKKTLFEKVDYWLDTHQANNPKLINRETMLGGLTKTAHQPFRVVPFFDPAPWGGQWMKEVCDLNRESPNYGWCFDCVPEENSLYLNVSGELFEMPANNLVFYQTQALLGGPVESRFGQDFPIRFDFLDTMEGGNLSLQVHPTTQYIKDNFGVCYTQDESYYLIDAEEDATIYLGLKTGINPEELITDLQKAEEEGAIFDADKYVNKWQAKKHDHYLIPAGTIHCSGKNTMVLEISSTPNLFTFKLWDWGRMGLDGRPRPINIQHGSHVLQWNRDTEYTRNQLINHIELIAEGEGWREERTGLHENEFIETRRHWFTKKVSHHTGGGVNVLNVIEGDELVVESPTNAFEPFIVHYAETFIIPAAVGDYTIRPTDTTKECGTIKAYVRFRE